MSARMGAPGARASLRLQGRLDRTSDGEAVGNGLLWVEAGLDSSDRGTDVEVVIEREVGDLAPVVGRGLRIATVGDDLELAKLAKRASTVVHGR